MQMVFKIQNKFKITIPRRQQIQKEYKNCLDKISFHRLEHFSKGFSNWETFLRKVAKVPIHFRINVPKK